MATEEGQWLEGFKSPQDREYEAYLMELSAQQQADQLYHEVLHLPLGENDADAATVGEYLGLLLSTLWQQAEGFSGKRPFGNGNWQWPVYIALIKAGLVNGSVYLDEGYEYIEDFDSEDEVAADELILQVILFAYKH